MDKAKARVGTADKKKAKACDGSVGKAKVKAKATHADKKKRGRTGVSKPCMWRAHCHLSEQRCLSLSIAVYVALHEGRGD